MFMPLYSTLGDRDPVSNKPTKNCRATGFVTSFVELFDFSKQCAWIILIKTKTVFERDRTLTNILFLLFE
uniref:Uncharacterized protein n=2 Tax=Pan TaxID=9596 RepID=A0A2I3RKJ2_PANTR